MGRGAQCGSRGHDIVDHEHSPFGVTTDRPGGESRTDQSIGSVSAGLRTTGQTPQEATTRNSEVSRHSTGDDLRLVESPTASPAISGGRPRDQIERATDGSIVAHRIGEFVGEQPQGASSPGDLGLQHHIACRSFVAKRRFDSGRVVDSTRSATGAQAMAIGRRPDRTVDAATR